MITSASAEDIPQVLALLEQCGLPQEGLYASLPTMIVACESDQVIGCAALEVYGTVALLRSVAVDPAHRSSGLGHQLVEAELAQARRRGIQEVYLLTETASKYFPRFGFRLIDRWAVSPAIHHSVEWTSACPVSAQAMVLQMKPGE
jgi:N-acetylglutamate synthase-like GNAT family acetyltransferase